MLKLACLHEVFTVSSFWREPSARLQQGRSFGAHPRPPASHRQMLPTAEPHAALFGRCCQTEGTLGRSVGTRCVLQAACLNELLHWQTSLLGTGLCHPPQASCLPNRWAQTLSVPENKHAHRLGAPDTRFVSPTQRHPIQTANAHCWVVWDVAKELPSSNLRNH